MVIMALDHVRQFYSATPFRPDDLTTTSLGWFASRWITDLCAPNFVFLSGMSIFLVLRRRSRESMSAFLLTRGLWLVFLEVFVITFLLQLSYQLVILQVIWVIGWSMMFMAAILWLPRNVIGILAVAILSLHNLVPQASTDSAAGILGGLFLHTPFIIQIPGIPPILVAYTIVPYLALMMAGYYAGAWLTDSPDTVYQRLWKTGSIMIVVFVVIRFVNVYGDPSPWAVQERGWLYTVLSFINVSKYPPSLLFDLSMVGIGMLMLALFTRFQNAFTRWLRVYGEVPFFYYILHLLFIAVSLYGWSVVVFGRFVNFGFAPQETWPAAYAPNYLRMLTVWILLVAVLYYPCRWFGNYKRTHKSRWLSYF